MVKFIVIDEKFTRGGDLEQTWTDLFNTAEEANAEAERAWRHLTATERKRRHVWAGKILPEDLNDTATDDEGNIDWGDWHSIHGFEGAFDSAEE